MTDRNVKMVRVIVRDRLPVERTRPDPHLLKRPQILEAIRGDLVLIRRHHLCHRGDARLKRHEQETTPIFQGDRKQSVMFGLQVRILVAVRNSDQPTITGIAPRMVGAGQDL